MHAAIQDLDLILEFRPATTVSPYPRTSAKRQLSMPHCANAHCGLGMRQSDQTKSGSKITGRMKYTRGILRAHLQRVTNESAVAVIANARYNADTKVAQNRITQTD